MIKKQFVALFVCSLGPYLVGSGLLPLLPLYAADLGAPPAVTGYYLAVSCVALAVGALAAGWLSNHFGRRRTWLILSAAVGAPVAWSVGRAGNMWALAALTSGLFFLGGVSATSATILAGLSAQPDERGKVFGFLGLAGGLGTVIGGLIGGPLVDRWGYPTLFAAMGVAMVLGVVAGLLVEDKKSAVRGPDGGGARAAAERTPLGRRFYLLFAASLATAILGVVSILGRSLRMDGLGFSATAISVARAMGTALTLPLPLLIGRLSDRVGRVPLMILCYAAQAASMVLLAVSTSLWQFWVAAALVMPAGTTVVALGKALATDLVPEKALDRGLSLYDTTAWIGMVIGFAVTGVAAQQLGLVPTLLGSVALPLISIALISTLRRAKSGALRPQVGKA